MPASILDQILPHSPRAEAAAVGFLIDGDAYFRAFREAVRAAEYSVQILAWDVHSETHLIPGEGDSLGPSQLAPFLFQVLAEKPSLQIHLLCWDFSMVYAAEREWRLLSRYFRNPPDRFHLHFDDHVPAGASHHQKVVTVDDSVAFIGGFDLGLWRWDTSRHLPHDRRRVNPDGDAYPPFHDVQAVVSGEAAKMLGDLCRERWQRATGERLQAPPAIAPDARWPASARIGLRGVEVAVARTRSAYEPHPEWRENLQAFLAAIGAARRFLYLENQYFSSPELAEALQRRLREPEGPEIVMVLTQDTQGWLEEGTMGVVRDCLLERLEKADAHHRLRVYYPESVGPDGARRPVYVHAKVLIADDRILKLGSANLSNRSMKVDTEADLVIADESPQAAIRRFRHELLGVAFARPPEEIAQCLSAEPSLIRGIESLIEPDRSSLRPFVHECKHAWQRALTEERILDPDDPIDPGYWLQQQIAPEQRPSVWRRLAVVTAGIVTILGVALLGRYGWGEWINQDALVHGLTGVRDQWWMPVAVGLLFAIGASVAVPLNLILVASAIVFGPWLAFGLGLVGAHLSAAATFGLGHHFGKPLIRRLSSRNIDRLSATIGERGLLSIALVRLVPVAPFLIINLVAGASQLRFRTFTLGSVLGMVPGMLGVALLASRFEAILRRPSWENGLLFGGIVALLLGALFFLRRKLGPGRRPKA